MGNYRRWRLEGGTFFFTVVTEKRRPLFHDPETRRLLREAFVKVKRRRPFEIPAIVLLPDHLHLIMQLPEGDLDYSNRIRQIKSLFTISLGELTDTRQGRSESRARRGEHNVWQRRFYEHTIRDEDDFIRCADYIHVNPVKHRLVTRVADWPWSSFHRWVAAGHYAPDWGGSDEWFGDEFE